MHSFAGQVLSYDNIREVIKFCAREKLVLFADEVYQETVFTNEVQFHSCKKVLRDLGPEYNKFQLMSIHSASKGFYGEYVQEDFAISKTQQRSMRRALEQPKIKNILKQSNILVIIWDSCKVFLRTHNGLRVLPHPGDRCFLEDSLFLIYNCFF